MAATGSPASFFEEQPFASMSLAKPSSSPGSSRSRSTSAGSSPPSSSTAELPSFEYPIPKLKCAKQGLVDVPEINYPSPLVVRNTFLDYGDCSPTSLVEFLHERETQSCPASGIGAPPGLEHLASQISEPGHVDFLPVRPDFWAALPSSRKATGLPDFEYPSPFVVRNTFLDTNEIQHLGSLADFMIERQSKSCPASGIGLPPGLSGVSSRFGGSGIDELPEAEAQPERSTFSPPPAYEPILPTLQMGVPPPPPMAPPSLPPAAQLPELPSFVPPPPPAQAPQLRIAESLPETELGTPEMPSVGSAGHRLGNCKPCAFQFAKGCGSGFNCSFCHLCPPGEKKRRQKVKQVAVKMSANLTASSVHPSLAIAAAASWAAARGAAQMAPLHRGFQMCGQ